jgi:hypothetical protein
MAIENTGFLHSLCVGNPAARYKLGPPSSSDYEPWHESERSAHDQFSNLVCIMQEVQRLCRDFRKIEGHEAERQWCAETFRNSRRLIEARLAGWQPSAGCKGN